MFSTINCSTINAAWIDPSVLPTIQLNANYLFVIDINTVAVALPQMQLLLDKNEAIKAASFSKDIERQQFVIGRAVTKILLGKFFQQNPHCIQISVSTRGKPFCEVIEAKKIHFNLSHSSTKISIAISCASIGVDIEKVNKNFDFTDIVENCFSADEANQLHESPSIQMQFYKFWTRKEALLKASGVGMIDNLASISCLDGKNKISSQIIQSDKDWFINSFEIDHDYIVSIASSINPTLQCCTLNAEEILTIIE